MKAHEKCTSRSFLIKSIWGYDDLNPISLDVFMSSIKTKLNQKYLYTVRNKGYFLTRKEQLYILNFLNLYYFYFNVFMYFAFII